MLDGGEACVTAGVRHTRLDVECFPLARCRDKVGTEALRQRVLPEPLLERFTRDSGEFANSEAWLGSN